jgi:UDP-glucose 4-epimerase
MPARVMGVLVDISWRARLQPIDRGWIEMALSVPLLDCARAREELDRRPTWSSTAAFAELIQGVCDGAHGESRRSDDGRYWSS